MSLSLVAVMFVIRKKLTAFPSAESNVRNLRSQSVSKGRSRS